jgi:hypothetical protein
MRLHKIKNCTTKEMVSKLKKPPTEWEKIFASYTSDKGLITQIYRKLKKLNSLKVNEPMKKWTTELNRTFSKEEIQMAKTHMKTCSPPLAIKEMQIKTILRFHFTPLKSLNHQKHHQQHVLVRMWGKGNPHTLLVGMQAGATTLEKNLKTS